MSINSIINNPAILSALVGEIYQYVIPVGTPIQYGTTFNGITIPNNKIGNVYKVDINITIVYSYPSSEPPPGPMQCILIAYVGLPISGNFIQNSISECDIQSGNFINLSSSFVYVSDGDGPLQLTFQASSKDSLPYLFVYSGTMIVHHLPNITYN
jgi:hypothetical protein